MPELPDVEGFRRIAEHAVGRQVSDVQVRDAGVLRSRAPEEFAHTLRDRYVTAAHRFGKWLALPIAGAPDGSPDGLPCLLLHFGMTGMLVWCGSEFALHPHDRVVFRFGEDDLRYRDMRKLKGIHLACRQSEVDGVLGELGPDAFEASAGTYRQRLTRTRRQLKPALMDQTVLAGLGNLTADEALWRARLHPRCATTDLDGRQLGRLYQRTRSMLRESVRAGRVLDRPSWLTGHRDEPSGQCPRCSTQLRHGRVGGRSTVWCPKCQPEER